MAAVVRPRIISFVCSSGLVLAILCWCRLDEGLHRSSLFPVDAWHAVTTEAKRSRTAFAVSSDLVRTLQKSQPNLLSQRQKTVITSDDVVFLVMASIAERQRIRNQRASWMRWAKHVLIFADAADAELGMMTLPEIRDKTGFAEAQFRQLYGMKWILRERPDLAIKSWFFLVDDDTWVNVPHLLTFCSQYPYTLPLSFSHVYLMFNSQAVYNGGAGMLFTQSAFNSLGTAVLTEACPLTDVDARFVNNDNILAACAFSVGVLKVTSSQFSTYEGVLHLENDVIETAWLDQITVHKIKDNLRAKRMFCLSETTRGISNQQC